MSHYGIVEGGAMLGRVRCWLRYGRTCVRRTVRSTRALVLQEIRDLIDLQAKEELIAEFPELERPEIILPKEVYAHFGLLFFKFSLVEHSLINALTYHHVGTELAAKRIKSKKNWEDAHGTGYNTAKQKTFGNLVRMISPIPEFAAFLDQLARIKIARDYFAHHFFREEVGIYRNDDGSWQVLCAIKQLRNELMLLDHQLTSSTKSMCMRLGVPWPSAEVLERAEAELIDEAEARIASGSPFNWAKKAI